MQRLGEADGRQSMYANADGKLQKLWRNREIHFKTLDIGLEELKELNFITIIDIHRYHYNSS